MSAKPKVAVIGIVGRTNSGKSTLLNKIVGEKVSIVSPVVQTTRNSIRAILDEGRGQLVFVDTPGLHKAESKLGTLINKMARHAAANVEALVVVFDVSDKPQLEDDGWMRRVLSSEEERPLFFFFNKCDREELYIEDFQDLWADIQREMGRSRKARTFKGSAASGVGVEKLIDSLFDSMPEGERLYDPDIISDYPRQLAMADIIREKIFLNLKDEVPHSVGVRIDKFDESNGSKWIVEATLLVARNSQKPIVIGPKGSTIKRIRLASQKDIRDQYEVDVELSLWVKVDKDWTTNPHTLRQMGYLGDY